MPRMTWTTVGCALATALSLAVTPVAGAVVRGDAVVPAAPQVEVAELDLAGVAPDALATLPADPPLPAEDLPAAEVAGASVAAPLRALSQVAAVDVAFAAAGDVAASPGDAVDPDVLTAPLDVAPFSVLGVTWDLTPGLEGVVIRYRVRQDGRWSGWSAAGTSDVAPDADRAEGRATRGAADAVVAVDADGVQLWAQAERGTVRGLTAVLVDPGEDPPGADATTAAFARPPIVPRTAWGADESAVTCDPDLSRQVQAAAVHHTASTNDYSAGDVPGLLRGFLAFHTRPESAGGRGWCDIGYNFLVDRFGRIFEGRGGSMERPVVGVHTGGFNSRTFGVAAIGTFSTTPPPAAMIDAFAQVIAWKFAAHRIRAGAVVDLESGGGASKYPAGTVVRFPTIFGHRDAQLTACPGERLYSALGAIRARVAALVNTTVAASPLGSWDGVAGDATGLTVSGWAFEPGSTAPATVRITVGNTSHAVSAGLDRPDVGAVHPVEGSRHGFRVRLEAPEGRHPVCVTAMNVGGGNDVSLGCLWVRVGNVAPVGALDVVRLTAGGVTLHGWALDRDSDAPLTVHVHVDGRAVRAARADGARPDVGRAHGTDGRHGYVVTVPVADGPHRVCVFAINVPRAANPSLGCGTVQVGAVPIGALDTVAGAPGAVRVTGWALDPDTTAPIAVHVYVDGRPVRSVRADRSRPDVDRVHRLGDAHGFSASVPAAPGPHTVCLYAINLPAGHNPALGCGVATVA